MPKINLSFTHAELFMKMTGYTVNCRTAIQIEYLVIDLLSKRERICGVKKYFTPTIKL